MDGAGLLFGMDRPYPKGPIRGIAPGPTAMKQRAPNPRSFRSTNSGADACRIVFGVPSTRKELLLLCAVVVHDECVIDRQGANLLNAGGAYIDSGFPWWWRWRWRHTGCGRRVITGGHTWRPLALDSAGGRRKRSRHQGRSQVRLNFV